MRLINFILFNLCFCVTLVAQEHLTLSQAIDSTLTNNYQIQIASLNNKVSLNNATKGNAGLLPHIYTEGGYDYANNNSDIDIFPFTSEGEAINKDEDGAASKTLTAAIKAEYTLFDGFGGYHRLAKLLAINGMSQLETQNVIENSVQHTINLYLQVAIEQTSIDVYEEQLQISREQLKRSKSDFKFGVKNRTDVLRAQVHLKNDSVALRRSLMKYKTAKTNLKAYMGCDLSTNYRVEEDLCFYQFLSKSDLKHTLETNNTLIQLADKGIVIAQYDIKGFKAQRMPKVIINGGYKYYDQKNDAGLFKQNTQSGWNLGVGLRFNIFDGKRIDRNIQNAQIKVYQNEIYKLEVRQKVLADFCNTYDEYTQAQEDLHIDESNLGTFEQSYQRSKIDFNNGLISSTDLRQSELDLLNAKLRIINASFMVKLKETELLKLTGLMLQK
ncbi:TolC family protein [Puteibacter caeruleilacunae]|nr:TolC family protein [Puteibacter caeruleilacunae]